MFYDWLVRGEAVPMSGRLLSIALFMAC
ncbi:hypothetical protein PSEUDO8O_31054 [Pseudomonas sp. 8O]|nr:hypothetical protein PSEUDO8O_31054 [Pseudomonas sp. 8O]